MAARVSIANLCNDTPSTVPPPQVSIPANTPVPVPACQVSIPDINVFTPSAARSETQSQHRLALGSPFNTPRLIHNEFGHSVTPGEAYHSAYYGASCNANYSGPYVGLDHYNEVLARLEQSEAENQRLAATVLALEQRLDETRADLDLFATWVNRRFAADEEQADRRDDELWLGMERMVQENHATKSAIKVLAVHAGLRVNKVEAGPSGIGVKRKRVEEDEEEEEAEGEVEEPRGKKHRRQPPFEPFVPRWM